MNTTATVPAGTTVTYTITLENLGPDTIDSVVLIDELPAQLAEPAFEASDGSYDAESGEWTGLDVAAAESVVLTLTATVGADAEGVGPSPRVAGHGGRGGSFVSRRRRSAGHPHSCGNNSRQSGCR